MKRTLTPALLLASVAVFAMALPFHDDVEVKALVSEVKSTMTEMKKNSDEVIKNLQASMQTAGADSAKALETANALAEKMTAQADSIIALEQKIADNVNKGNASPKTLGKMVIESEQWKSFASGNGGQKFKIQANTIIGQEGSPPANSDTIVAPHRLPGIIGGAFRPLRVRDILNWGTTTSNMVEYTRELSWTNNAAETAEAAQKPESALTFELAEAPVRTIAHFIKVSKQVLSDAPALQSYIDTRMRYGVEYRIDSQLLNGDGNGQNLSGMLDAGNFTPYTPLTGDNALDTINRAIYGGIGADYPATAIIMNPADWGAIERLKVGASDATYVVGNPTGILGPRLWGLPVVTTNAMPQGKFLVANFEVAYQGWNREGTVVEIFEQDTDNVQKNLLTVRAEARLALATYVPAAARSGNLVV